MMRKNHKDEEITIWEALVIAWDILLTVLVLTTLFAFGGIYADKYFETNFVFTIIGFICLVVIGQRILIRKAKRIQTKMNITKADTDPNKRP